MVAFHKAQGEKSGIQYNSRIRDNLQYSFQLIEKVLHNSMSYQSDGSQRQRIDDMIPFVQSVYRAESHKKVKPWRARSGEGRNRNKWLSGLDPPMREKRIRRVHSARLQLPGPFLKSLLHRFSLVGIGSSLKRL